MRVLRFIAHIVACRTVFSCLRGRRPGMSVDMSWQPGRVNPGRTCYDLAMRRTSAHEHHRAAGKPVQCTKHGAHANRWPVRSQGSATGSASWRKASGIYRLKRQAQMAADMDVKQRFFPHTQDELKEIASDILRHAKALG